MLVIRFLMSLRKRPTITPRMMAANRANARKSTGPKSPEGKNRVRFNGLRHGQRAQSLRGAIAALGGNPADLEIIIREDYFMANSLKEQRLIERMAYEDWLLSGQLEKTIFFSTDQSRNVV